MEEDSLFAAPNHNLFTYSDYIFLLYLPTRVAAEKKCFGGAIRIEPVLTTTNGKFIEIWKVLERVCENPGGVPLPCSPLPTPMFTILKSFMGLA